MPSATKAPMTQKVARTKVGAVLSEAEAASLLLSADVLVSHGHRWLLALWLALSSPEDCSVNSTDTRLNAPTLPLYCAMAWQHTR